MVLWFSHGTPTGAVRVPWLNHGTLAPAIRVPWLNHDTFIAGMRIAWLSQGTLMDSMGGLSQAHASPGDASAARDLSSALFSEAYQLCLRSSSPL